MEPLPAIGLDEVRAAAESIRGEAIRAPLLRIGVDSVPEIHVKLENLQPMGSYKLRGALNSVAVLEPERIADGLSTASAGNMARAVAWLARRHGVPATMIVPDSAPAAKLELVRSLGARVIPVPFADWWQAMEEGGHPDLPGAFLHPCASRPMIAGDGTIGLELVEDLPGLAAVVVPFGGGGLASGIACAVKALRPDIRVYAAEVEGAAPLAAALEAGHPVAIERHPSFVDGIGSGTVLPAMWPLYRRCWTARSWSAWNRWSPPCGCSPPACASWPRERAPRRSRRHSPVRRAKVRWRRCPLRRQHRPGGVRQHRGGRGGVRFAP